MKFDKNQLELYAITDRSWLKKDQSIYDIVEQAIAGGATMIQVREKNLSKRDFIKEVCNIKPLCYRNNIPLIVNDDLSIAIESNADGIHLGQQDLKKYLIESSIPKSMILGISAQNLEQAIEAKNMGAHYLGVGAIFPTSSKDDAQNLNISILKEITKNVDIPVVAIGGINEDNIPLLSNTNINGVSIISAIFAKDDVKTAAENLKKIIRRTSFYEENHNF